MPPVPVDDKIEAVFDLKDGAKIRATTSRFWHLFRKDVSPNPKLKERQGQGQDLVVLTILLDRPDTSDEGVITEYESEVRQLASELHGVSISIILELPPFETVQS